MGYSRAVRVGHNIHVAGTTAVDENGQVVGKGDPRAQTLRILEFFRTVKPASTMVEVSRLVSPDMAVEIAVDAYVEERA